MPRIALSYFVDRQSLTFIRVRGHARSYCHCNKIIIICRTYTYRWYYDDTQRCHNSTLWRENSCAYRRVRGESGPTVMCTVHGKRYIMVYRECTQVIHNTNTNMRRISIEISKVRNTTDLWRFIIMIVAVAVTIARSRQAARLLRRVVVIIPGKRAEKPRRETPAIHLRSG